MTTTTVISTLPSITSNTSIFTLISSMGPYAPLFLFFAGILGIMVLYMIASIIGKPLNIKLGAFAIALGGKNGEIPTVNYDKKYLIERVRNLVTKSVSAQRGVIHDIFPRQLNFARERIVEINAVMCKAYSELLKEKLPNNVNVKGTMDFRNYRLLVQMMTNECIKEKVLVKALKENHLTEMDGSAWDEFVQRKVEVTLALLTEYLDVMYNGTNLAISRNELSDLNEETKKTVKMMIKSIYEAAREISKSDTLYVKTLNDELEKDLDKLSES